MIHKKGKSVYFVFTLFSIVLWLGMPFVADAANGVPIIVKGQVLDMHNHNPVPNAKVELISGETVEGVTITDENGYFEIAVNALADTEVWCVVKISHISYERYKKRVALRGEPLNLGLLYLDEKMGTLDEFVVTSTRTRGHLKDIPIPTLVIKRAQIDRIAPTSIKDIFLYTIPGIEFSQHGGITHISMQGFSAEYITFLIDGEEVSGLKSGSMDFMRLSPDNIERIEFVKGAGSALYGSSAIAGVVNIITRQNDNPKSLYASAGYTHKGQWTSFLQGGLKREKWNLTTSLAHDLEGGYTISTKDEASSMKVPLNKVYRFDNKFNYTPSDRVAVKWNINASRRIQDRNEYQNDRYDYLTNAISAGFGVGEKGQMMVMHNLDISWRERLYPKAESESEKKDLLHRNLKQVAKVQYNHAFSENSNLNVGLEGHEEHLKSDQIEEASKDKKIRYGVLYAQHLWKVFQQIDLMYGLRADIHSAYGLHVSPKISIGYHRGPFGMRLGYYHAFKSPSMMELFYEWSHLGMFNIHGNPDLKPEKAQQFLFGLEWNQSRVNLTANLTHTKFRDRIVMYEDNKGDQQHTNIDGESKMTTFDLQASWRVCNGFSVHSSYVYTYNPTKIDVNGEKVDISTTRPHNVLLRLEGYKAFKHWHLMGTLMGQYLSTINTHTITKNDNGLDEVSPLKYEGYPMFRVTLGALIHDRYSITLGVDNLFNHRPKNLAYQNASLSPGRVPFAKISVRLP